MVSGEGGRDEGCEGAWAAGSEEGEDGYVLCQGLAVFGSEEVVGEKIQALWDRERPWTMCAPWREGWHPHRAWVAGVIAMELDVHCLGCHHLPVVGAKHSSIALHSKLSSLALMPRTGCAMQFTRESSQ